MPGITRVDSPIVIFISSRQKEFEKPRLRLRETIDNLTVFKKLMLKGELVEKRGGSRIRSDIIAALDVSTIYVGIFGNQFSESSEWEFKQAMRRGLVPLVFDVLSPSGAKHKRDKRVKKFLDEVREAGIRTTAIVDYPTRPSGRESLDPRYRKLIDPVTGRIINEVAEMVQQNLEIRKKLLSVQ